MLKHDTKTVYDPTVRSDQSMLRSAQKAGEQAFSRYKADPSKTVFHVTQDAIKFQAYIRVDRQTGATYVANVHPVR